MEKLPTEIILHQLSFMDNKSIKNLCKSNVQIYNICKNNRNFITKIYNKNIAKDGEVTKRLVKICKMMGINCDLDKIRLDRRDYVLDIILDNSLSLKSKLELINNPHLKPKLPVRD